MDPSYNIDRRRIYANGMSNGGGMTFVLSCTLSNRIAAVGLVSAGPGGRRVSAEWMLGRYSHSIDATGQMWAFFAQHPLAN